MTARFRHGPATVESVAALVGRTPLVRIRSVTSGLRRARVYAKLEYFNPGGSVKDRAALQMLRDAHAAGQLDGSRAVIDSTSGNTGIAYCWLGAALGLKIVLVMPENVSAARKEIAAAFGAQVVYSSNQEGSDGAIRLVRQLVAEAPDRYFYPDQYSNESNPRAHYLTTGPEIWEQTQGQVTHFVCGIGTTGTVMGTGRRLKQLRPGVRVIAVEPAEPMHGLEGLKHLPSSIVPGIFRETDLDEKLSISTDDGWDMADRLLEEEGLFVGHSSGAAMVGALQVAQRAEAEGQDAVVVTVFPDRAERYFEPPRPKRT